MEERKVAYKTAEKFVKDKRTQEKVLKKFVYVDMGRASQSEKELIQMLVSSGYEVKKWNSVKKTTGITAEIMYQYLKEQINIDINNKKALQEEQAKLLSDLKSNTNFMSILRAFSEKHIKTIQDKEYITSLICDEDTIQTIGAIKVEKVRQRKIRENIKRLSAQAKKQEEAKKLEAQMTRETTLEDTETVQETEKNTDK